MGRTPAGPHGCEIRPEPAIRAARMLSWSRGAALLSRKRAPGSCIAKGDVLGQVVGVSEIDVRQAAANLRKRIEARQRKDLEGWELARQEAEGIVALCVKAGAKRVYQWGSVLQPERFRSYSDVDVAVEGLPDPELIFRLQETADEHASFPVHLVELEKIEPEYAESIRQSGKLVYGRETGN